MPSVPEWVTARVWYVLIPGYERIESRLLGKETVQQPTCGGYVSTKHLKLAGNATVTNKELPPDGVYFTPSWPNSDCARPTAVSMIFCSSGGAFQSLDRYYLKVNLIWGQEGQKRRSCGYIHVPPRAQKGTV